MRRKYIFFGLGLLLLAAAGGYGYYKWQAAQRKVDLWSLVPDDAVFVLETNRPGVLVRQLQQTELWENIARLPYFTNLTENLTWLDSAAEQRLTIRDFVRRKKMLSSVHVTGKNSFDLLLYVPVSSVREHRYVRNVVENIQKSPLFQVEEQE